MNKSDSKKAIDSLIKKARVHLYKPIQIAEILHRDRVIGDIDLLDLETYRTKSKKWRDVICIPFLGRTSTSSAKYQDDLFNKNAIPPKVLYQLGVENKNGNGAVEAYIYEQFRKRLFQMSNALDYARLNNRQSFNLTEFLNLFWKEAGLKRSIDKIYEIVVYSLFTVLVEELDVSVEVKLNPSKIQILSEFEDFAKKVINIDTENTTYKSKANVNRVGVTNAADRGLDMWANFGPAIQIKHLSLDVKLAKDIVSTVTSDRIVIVCKDSEQNVIRTLLQQIGWQSRIQSIIVESELIEWYEKALRGIYAHKIGNRLLQVISEEIVQEFPTSDNTEFIKFWNERGYNSISSTFWS